MDQAPERDISAAVDSRFAGEPYRAGALASMLQLHWFIRLRWGSVIAVLAALGVERVVFSVKRPGAGALVITIAVLALVNGCWMV